MDSLGSSSDEVMTGDFPCSTACKLLYSTVFAKNRALCPGKKNPKTPIYFPERKNSLVVQMGNNIHRPLKKKCHLDVLKEIISVKNIFKQM